MLILAQVMGKSSSKLSAESLERLKQPGSEPGGAAPYLLNEKELRNWCKGFNKDFPDAQLTKILDNEDLLAPFLTEIFYQEVEVSDCVQTLFRGNCLASKIMSHCFRTFGSKYLKQLLEPHLKPLLATPYECGRDKETASNSPARLSRLSNDATANIENNAQLNTMQPDEKLCLSSPNTPISYEIDSTRLEENGNIIVNAQNLLKLTKQILDSILSSASDFPPQLNSMCICLRQVLSKKYPNSSTNLKAVGTVMFLRFINPAIVSPYEAGIVDRQPDARTMRGLMLVSKILQNIANNVEFSKEGHMLPFNSFVRTHFEPMRKWVSEISTERDRTATPPAE